MIEEPSGPKLVCSVLVDRPTCEYLGIEEPSEPKLVWSTTEGPVVKLLVPLEQLCEPEAQRRRLPGDLLPELWHSRIIHAVQSIPQILRHDDGS